MPCRAFTHNRASFSANRATLVAGCNFSRQYAELIDMPIADKHPYRRHH